MKAKVENSVSFDSREVIELIKEYNSTKK